MTEMEHSKLMIPLFYGHSFNREGRKMRAVFEREISDGAQTYRLWRGTGTPDVDYPRAENDKYLLHVEINSYLLPLGMTDFYLVNDCGFEPAAEKLYGGGKTEASGSMLCASPAAMMPSAPRWRRKQRRLSDLAVILFVKRNLFVLCWIKKLIPI